ncbi:MAG: site-specific DNA-methyltransferase [Rhizobiales bacterium]|nr:site-specific DNA-methyltransferase [Hyphomicrobiales bacterium]
MSKKTKLELTWIGKDERPKLEPRILIEDPAKSYHAAARRSEADIFDNMLIKGDNLLALKALESQFEGQVKCVFIDPPYNTGSAFEHYDDGLEHSIWLSMMRDRLIIIQRLLRDDGSLWVTIDDNESHYLKVLCDEIFGRKNFLVNCIWERTTSARNDAKFFSSNHDHILVYAKNIELLKLNRMPRTEASDAAYSNPDSDPRGDWREGDYKCAKSADERPNLFYPIQHPHTGEEVWPRRERVWAYSRTEHERHIQENLLWWGKTGNYRMPKLKRFRFSAPPQLVPGTIWPASEVTQTRTARTEMKEIFGSEPFATPKPEALMEKIVRLATDSGDLVLDSFAGSGTTGAVAHKMGRRWIMVELGEHCDTHILPRMKKVINGEDKGGVTEAAGWKGGGGFRYFNLAPSLLEQDRYGNWVISKDYNPAMLAEAMCKHMGYTYAPSLLAEEYWNHGYATEKSFIYVTTQQLTHDACRKISEDVGPERSLVVCCKAFSANPDSFENLILVKIPSAILTQCEWGRDDYSLNIAKLPLADDDGDEELDPASKEELAAPKRKKKIAAKDRFGDLSGLDLFDDLGTDADKSEG